MERALSIFGKWKVGRRRDGEGWQVERVKVASLTKETTQ